MLHSIVINIVDVTFNIGFIADRMFPRATLPDDTLLSLTELAWRASFRIEASREPALNQTPTRGEIGVIVRQRPNRVNVIWQCANRDCLEWAALLDYAVNIPKVTDLS
jgi:hypothetical protein